jgi:hypothetical protein
MVAREKPGPRSVTIRSSTPKGNLTRSPALAWPDGPQSASYPANPLTNRRRGNQISASVARFDFFGVRERARDKIVGD